MTENEIRLELKKLRAENKRLKDFIKENLTTKAYDNYLKSIKNVKVRASTYEEEFIRESKKLKIKTKLIKLMREYNKIVKASNIKVGFPKITIKSLQKQGFKPTRKNLKMLEAQIKETITRVENTEFYPYDFLLSMLENIVFAMFKLQFAPELINAGVYIRDSDMFKKACENVQYNASIKQILELLYDTVANGDEEETRKLLQQLMEIIDEVTRS